MISYNVSGSTRNLEKALRKMSTSYEKAILDKYGQIGVDLLSANTPKDSGKTASSWSYKLVLEDGGYKIEWHNTNVNKGHNVAVLIQIGHGTGTGGYVQGVDYINPSMVPVFEGLRDDILRDLTR